MSTKDIKMAFTIVAFFVGFIPMGSFVLIPAEMLLVYLILNKNDNFKLTEFAVICAVLATATTFLKGLAQLLHLIPVLGQITNSIIAAVVMYIIGSLAESHKPKQ
jgi:hypothetical protein